MDADQFRQIAPRCGGQSQAFEELCCQIARRTLPDDASFVRLHGSGGDGGVECFADLSDGSRIGWQAKFVFNMNALIKQVSGSLDTALKIHKGLTQYIVCFPFNPTGPTGRPGESGVTKFREWKSRRESAAREAGRHLVIEDWSASRILSEVLKIDAGEGIRAYFFNEPILSRNWFEDHLSHALRTAGPRYTQELNVETDLWKWLGSLGQTDEWAAAFQAHVKMWDPEFEHLVRALKRKTGGALNPAWPESNRAEGEACVTTLTEARRACSTLLAVPSRGPAVSCSAKLSRGLSELEELEIRLADDLDARHGRGRSDSPSFRHFMAEYQCSFPAANLDAVRDTIEVTQQLLDWLRSPAGWSAFESVLLLLGDAGSGKTHGICDAAAKRLKEDHLSVVAFGHEFRGEPDPWTRLCESLGLPSALGRDALLDALNSAAEASGHPLIIFVDAINETKPLSYWRNCLSSFAEAVRTRPFLRLCATCRTAYKAHCTPDASALYEAEHQGFAGIERVACQTFFAHYGLEPPVTPILQPELANPLYLRLVCQTLQSKGLPRMPAGWLGLAPAIKAFLEEKDRQFALSHDRRPGMSVVSKSLLTVARSIASSGESALTCSVAERLIHEQHATAPTDSMIEWLVREDLLIEDAPRADDAIGAESVVRPAFERLGDFLIAKAALTGLTPSDLPHNCGKDGRLFMFLGSPEAIAAHQGIVSALSILVPEHIGKGTELPDVLPHDATRTAALRVAVSSYPWRDPSSFTSATQSNLLEALSLVGFAGDATDAALAGSWMESVIDAFWLHGFLSARPMAERDAFWCGFLHERFESLGPTRRLIDAAFELPLDQVDSTAAERWATMLLWFTAAADRRVKDQASRSATAVLTTHACVLPSAVARMMGVDDDAVRERTLLAAYGACIRSRDRRVVAAVCQVLIDAIVRDPEKFHNALLRDHSRSIAELAQLLGEQECHNELRAHLDSLESPWPLDLPTDEAVESWDQLPRLVASCCHEDFFRYSMGCLHRWESGIPPSDMARWILKRIIDGFGYAGSGCERYDEHMLHSYGFGRGKATWAERIGKKYQWIAMYELASRLADHADQKRDSWAPALLREPLILLEERQMDPTLPWKITKEDREGQAWWIPASVDFQGSTRLSDKAWSLTEDDVPDLRCLLTPVHVDEEDWRLLTAFTSWRRCDEDSPADVPYRQIWAHVQGYLVDYEVAATAFSCLRRRNFFGRWMPESPSWLYGFAGEYPWGAAFNTEPEEWHGMGGQTHELPCVFTPANSKLAVEWEYDASLPRSLHLNVPARVFFDSGDLWWDHRDGFQRSGGRTVFRDPSITEPGPSALIADVRDLAARLKQAHRRFLWTLLGEKRILGGGIPDRNTPPRTFSQVALLNEDGCLALGDLMFFDDYGQATGPAQDTSRKRSSARRTDSSPKQP